MQPLLVYDGNCGFCKRWVERVHAITGDRVRYAPFQEVATEFPEVPLEKFQKAVQFFEDKKHTSAAHAAFRVLTYARGWGWLLFCYRFLPGFALVSEWIYRLIARRRKGSCTLHAS